LPRTVLSASSALPVTGVLAVGGVVKNGYMYGAAQTPTQLLGRQMSRTPVCEHATSISRQNHVQIQYLNPSAAGWLERVARASGSNVFGSKFTNSR